jgi:hypothetical protein
MFFIGDADATKARCDLFRECRHLLSTCQADTSIDANSQECIDDVGRILGSCALIFKLFDESYLELPMVDASTNSATAERERIKSMDSDLPTPASPKFRTIRFGQARRIGSGSWTSR